MPICIVSIFFTDSLLPNKLKVIYSFTSQYLYGYSHKLITQAEYGCAGLRIALIIAKMWVAVAKKAGKSELVCAGRWWVHYGWL